MDWWGKYVVGKQMNGLHFKDHGRDWDGVDCYGLVCLIYQEEFGISLLQYHTEYVNTDDRTALAEILQTESIVQDGWESLSLQEDLKPYDIVVFRIYGQPLHCGVVIGPGHMIHCMDGHDVAVERYCTKLWSARVSGVYRHPAVGVPAC
jgi:cell wall-associated NlpC family hydrolase